MKIYYLNDTNKSVAIYRDGLTQDNFVRSLAPAEGTTVDVNMPSGAIPFIKNWGSYVMISYTTHLEDSTPSPLSVA